MPHKKHHSQSQQQHHSAAASSRASSSSSSSSRLSMKIKCGIIGLPNVGKSTLFNALARKSLAQAENFPFCTIDPNVAQIAIPDAYLQRLGVLAKSTRTVSATMEFVDVAGLVKGASRGEGLGNQFLATIRECDAVIHLVRNYQDNSVIHVDGRVDPAADIETVNMELILADEAHVERRLEKASGVEERETLETILAKLKEGIPARTVNLSPAAKFSIKGMGLLTLKPVIYAFNVDEADFLFAKDEVYRSAEAIMQSIQYCDTTSYSDLFAVVSAKLEADVSERSAIEQIEYLVGMGLENIADERQLEQLLSYGVLPTMIRRLLHLGILYTGPGVPPNRSKTTRAHVFRQEAAPTALQMAGRLHGDIEKGFIRAEVTPAPVLLEHVSYAAAKDAGCVRTEGKDYVLSADDVILVKWK